MWQKKKRKQHYKKKHFPRNKKVEVATAATDLRGCFLTAGREQVSIEQQADVMWFVCMFVGSQNSDEGVTDERLVATTTFVPTSSILVGPG